MTQPGARPATEDGGHPLPVAAQVRPANRVDAREDSMEATLLDPVLDRSLAQPERAELRPRDDTVLPPNEPPNGRLRIHYPHSGGKCTVGIPFAPLPQPAVGRAGRGDEPAVGRAGRGDDPAGAPYPCVSTGPTYRM